jgi:hypothetical protein
MEKNYTTNLPSKNETQRRQKPGFLTGISMETKILLAKIGLLICIIVLIVAKTFSH